MKIKLLLFGIFTDIFKNTQVFLDVPSSLTVGQLKDIIVKNHPQTKSLNFAVAIDETYAIDTTVINKSNEVALIPPVSGG